MNVAQHIRNASESVLGALLAYRASGPYVMYLQWTGGCRMVAKKLGIRLRGADAGARRDAFAYIA